MTQNFKAPDVESDRQEVARASRGGKQNFWRPKDGDNVIRILPARADAPAHVNYHLHFAKHIMQYGNDWEFFVCMQETYGKPDPVCDKRRELLTLAKKMGDEKLKNEAGRFRTSRFGLFNIVDMADEKKGVQLYECSYVVWLTIVKLVSQLNGKYNDIVLKRDAAGQVVLDPNGIPLGRQILIYYNPKEANPGRKYEIYPDELSPIAATKERFDELMNGVVHLDLEKFYPEITYEEARIRAFGTPEQRAALRAQLDAKKVKEPVEEEEPEEDAEFEASAATPSPAAAPAPVQAPPPAVNPAPATAEAPPTPAPAPAPATPPAESDVLAEVKRRVAALRKG